VIDGPHLYGLVIQTASQTQTLVEFAILGLSLVVLVRLLPTVLGYLRDPSTRWTAFGLLVFVAGSLVGEMTQLRGILAFKLAYVAPLIVALVAPLAGKRPAQSRAISARAIAWILLLWAWLVAVNIAHFSTVLSDGTLLTRLMPGLIWVLLLATHASSPLDREMLAVVAAFAVAVPGLLVPFASEAWRACDQKCGVFEGMLTGQYASENFMGHQVAFVVALHLVAFGLSRTLYLLPLAALWLLATESRTAQYALLTTFALVFAAWLGSRIVKSRPGRTDSTAKRALITLVPVLTVAVAARLVLTSADDDFSGRGHIWGRAVDLWQGHEIAGLGVDAWEINQQNGLLPPQLYAHSVYVFLAFSGGIVAILIFVLLVRQAMLSALRQDGRLLPGLVLGLAFLLPGLLEVIWNPVAIDGFTWFPLALVVASGSPSPGLDPHEDPDAEQGAQRMRRRRVRV